MTTGIITSSSLGRSKRDLRLKTVRWCKKWLLPLYNRLYRAEAHERERSVMERKIRSPKNVAADEWEQILEHALVVMEKIDDIIARLPYLEKEESETVGMQRDMRGLEYCSECARTLVKQARKNIKSPPLSNLIVTEQEHLLSSHIKRWEKNFNALQRIVQRIDSPVEECLSWYNITRTRSEELARYSDRKEWKASQAACTRLIRHFVAIERHIIVEQFIAGDLPDGEIPYDALRGERGKLRKIAVNILHQRGISADNIADALGTTKTRINQLLK